MIFDDAETIGKARQVFQLLQQLGNDFDPGYADLYSLHAIIKHKRRYPTGAIREMEMTGEQYRELIRGSMPLAQEQNDRSTLSAVSYTLEGGEVRVQCSRYSERKNYSSPYEVVVGPDVDGKWRILEEISESAP